MSNSTWEEIFIASRVHKYVRRATKKEIKHCKGLNRNQVEYIISRCVNYKIRLIKINKYKPDPVSVVPIPKKNGNGHRKLAIPYVADRIIAACVNDFLYPCFCDDWSNFSYAFQKNKNCNMAICKAMEYISSGLKYAIAIDLEKCFDNIDQNQVRFLLRRRISNDDLLNIITNFIQVSYVENNKKFKKVAGVPQGNPLSPLLCNIVLDVIDKIFEAKQFKFIRYADDIVVFVSDEDEAEKVLSDITRIIIRKTKIPVNSEKSAINNVKQGISCLGFFIYEDGNNVLHLIPNKNRVEQMKDVLKKDISVTDIDLVVKRINEVTRGWLEYYKIAEMNKLTKNLDCFIKRQLDRKEKNSGVVIDRSKLINCNQTYKNMKIC